MWSSAAVAHSPQGLTCCVSRDALLHTSVVTSGYLSYSCLSISSNESGHSPLTSGIKKAFAPTELLFTGYFLFIRPLSVNPRDGYTRQSGIRNIPIFFTWMCINYCKWKNITVMILDEFKDWMMGGWRYSTLVFGFGGCMWWFCIVDDKVLQNWGAILYIIFN